MSLPLSHIFCDCLLLPRTPQKCSQSRGSSICNPSSITPQATRLRRVADEPSKRIRSLLRHRASATASGHRSSQKNSSRKGSHRIAAEGSSLTGLWIGSDGMASPAPADREDLETDEARHAKRPRLDAPPPQEQIVKGSGLANRALRSVLKGKLERSQLLLV